eukprot:snap_masked-scaffold_12-processed-gene-7.36-mRNA-1 protein AED:1.00 eAED:1.00 QI:0/-1/0/0/-1/1/1/0/271
MNDTLVARQMPLEVAAPLKTRYEHTWTKVLHYLLGISSFLLLSLVVIRKFYLISTLSPLGVSLQINSTLVDAYFPLDGGDQDDLEDSSNFDDYELVKAAVSVEDVVNLIAELFVASITPFLGMYSFVKKSDGSLSFFFYLSFVAGFYIAFTVSVGLLNGFYNNPQSSFPECFPGDSCFETYVYLEYTFVFMLFFCSYVAYKLHKLLDSMSEEMNAMEDAEIIPSAELAESLRASRSRISLDSRLSRTQASVRSLVDSIVSHSARSRTQSNT